ncbi:LysM peptidoglycan-binding domain-containing protein [Defluviimonas sp. WL0024]|uniref:LysM peptidoglycan-binding domain-containing protein n=2 Tax=Albidovulum TaxID=205889 RepID=A0ABT3J3Z8_9RHOB|nr:LysM peptidoglycan-binding domain-containing protein [Defluviimonas sp. WL0024]MCU9847894.1 LysM peptidoglycan-binding domain-containing protein [Defluviimonas sp. WL0024]MCW3782393.1 LysM peptidoglycan-binding domain-containing protein [Defluviimonas salinarum]
MKIQATFVKLAATCAVVAIMSPAAFAQEACTNYTVKDGDTLGTIAKAAYGSLDYQIIFNANRQILGSNPNGLEPGTELVLPCEDGRLTADAPAPSIELPEASSTGSSSGSSVGAYRPKVKFVSGNDWSPFADESLTGGGIAVRLATTAMHRGGNDREYTVNWVDDWDSHTTALLPSGAFDIGLAWYMPNCEKIGMLSESMAKRCTDYDASLPLYEPVSGFYAKPGSKYATAKAYADFEGARICRLEGYYTFDLEEQGLVEPTITMVRPAKREECFEGMMFGNIDIVAMEVQSAADVIKTLGIEAEVVENPYLSSVMTMAALAHKSNPFGREYLAMINRGLTEMRDTGEWYDVISGTLQEVNERSASN